MTRSMRVSSRCRWSALLVMLVISGTCESQLPTPAQDRSDWINPSDMINYDSSTKTMTKTTDTSEPTKESVPSTQNSQEPNCNDALQPCLKAQKEALEKLKSCEESLEELPVSHNPFFKQFIKHFIKKIKVDIETHEVSHFEGHIQLSGADLATLKRFAETEGIPPQSSHEILTRMITYVKHLENYKEPTLNDMIAEFFGGCQNIIILSLCTIIVVLFCSSAVKIHLNRGYSYLSIFLIIVMFMFVISVPWNWWHLYKKKVAERLAVNMEAIPKECLGGEQTTAQTLFGAIKDIFTFRQDACVKYHESLLIDPMWEVPPTKAIAVTITKFLLEPLEHIAESFSLVIRKLLQDMPTLYKPVVLFIFIIFCLFIMIVVAGYRINFFHLIQVGPGQPRPQAIAPNVERERVQELTSQVNDLTGRLEAAERDRTRMFALVEEVGSTEGHPSVACPTLLPLQQAPSAPGPSTDSLASGDATNPHPPSEKAPKSPVTSSGDIKRTDISEEAGGIPDKTYPSREKTKAEKDDTAATPDDHKKQKDATVSAKKTEIIGIGVMLTSECTESGTDSDIEIISQDDMTKL